MLASVVVMKLVMRDGKIMKAADLRAARGISGPPKRWTAEHRDSLT